MLRRRALPILMTAIAGSGALAQPLRLDWRDLPRADEGVVDRGPNAGSLRAIQPLYRQEDSFDNLFRLPTAEGDVFARRSGGVTALFPRSAYRASRFGPVPVVPADTTFVIGEPPAWLLERFGAGELADDGPRLSPFAEQMRSDTRVERIDAAQRDDTRADGRFAGVDRAEEDRLYRLVAQRASERATLAEIIRRAARAEVARTRALRD